MSTLFDFADNLVSTLNQPISTAPTTLTDKKTAQSVKDTAINLDDTSGGHDSPHSTPKKRKNNPEQLRHSLINAAKDLMIRDGIANVSMQKVADEAGVSKGGLFHHFKNKDELISSVIGLFIAKLNTAILSQCSQMGHIDGVFSRAYLQVMLYDADIGIMSSWAGLMRAINSDTQMQAQWQDWLSQKLKAYQATDSHAKHLAVRYAVDGAWLNDDKLDSHDIDALYRVLVGMLDS